MESLHIQRVIVANVNIVKSLYIEIETVDQMYRDLTAPQPVLHAGPVSSRQTSNTRRCWMVWSALRYRKVKGLMM